MLLTGCDVAPPAVVTPPPSTPRVIPTLAARSSPAIAAPVTTATPTPVIAGDYGALVRDRLMSIDSRLAALDRQFAEVRASPFRMTQDDWRTATLERVEELGVAANALRALGARSGPEAMLYGEVSKLLMDLDFVVSEYRMAFDFDPDGNHFVRAGRAERMASDEVQSILRDLRVRTAPTFTPAPH